MMTRILTALAGIPALLLLLFWPGGMLWFLAIAILMGLATWEYTAALDKRGIWIHWIAMALYGAAMLFNTVPFPLWLSSPGLSAYRGLYDGIPALLRWDPPAGYVGPGLAMVILLAGDLAWKRRNPVRNVGATLLGVGYVGALFPFLTMLRWWDGTALAFQARPPGDFGAWVVLTVLGVIWAGDSAAYFGGRAWGRRKCAPSVSPNKTWEGVFCGLAASAVVGAWAWGTWMHLRAEPALLWAFGAAFGLMVGAAGQVGDLVESAMKREIGVKDFGTLLPGHGGVLDRFDSLLFAAPTAWALLRFVLPLVAAARS